MQAKEFKVSLIGYTGTGKTSFVERLLYGQRRITTTSLRKTLGVDVYPFDYKYGGDKFRINFWDCAGDDRLMGLGKQYLHGSDLTVIFSSGIADVDQGFIDWVPHSGFYIIIMDRENTAEIISLIRQVLE
jgi:GTPase SAR1 family protein